MRLINWAWILLLIYFLSSCRDTFDHTIYSAEVPEEYKNLRAKNFQRLIAYMPDPSDTSSFKIALISDTHTYYDDLHDAIDDINKDADVKFILHGGDMTDGGLLAEFLLFQNIVSNSSRPYFTVIGNHDCLANGFDIYENMFGPENYSFVSGNCKFIFFNDVIWELEFREPDYYWLSDELSDHENYSHVFVISHIAPYNHSFTPLHITAFTSLMDSAEVNISIHGHHHDHAFNEYYDDGVMYMNIGSVSKRYYVTLDIKPDTVIKKVKWF